jgi:hypothetical protein
MSNQPRTQVRDPVLAGPELRARNIRWYLRTMSPEEFPLKPGAVLVGRAILNRIE